jgi:hypothetical protein
VTKCQTELTELAKKWSVVLMGKEQEQEEKENPLFQLKHNLY